MSKLLFKKGSFNDLKANVITGNKATEGAFYVTEDEGCLYLGQEDGKLKRIQGSVLFFETLTRFEDKVVKAPPYSTDVIYFIASENALVRWTGSDWKVLNADPAEVSSTLAALQLALDEVSATANGALQTTGGTMSGVIAMGNNKITGLATPTDNADAATKKYVDDKDAELLGTAKDDAGDTTIHGALKAAAAADAKAVAADGKAVAAQGVADAALARTGGTMTGDIAMSNKKITGLGAPTANTDAANKKYVDDAKEAALNASNTVAGNLNTLSGTVSGINTRLGEAEATIGAHTSQLDSHGGTLNSHTQLIEANAAAAQEAKEAATAANNNANTRVLSTDFDAFKTTNSQAIQNAVGKADAAQKTADDALPKAGGTMSGDITMSNSKTIKNVPTPSANTDVANKKYVDDAKSALLGASTNDAGATTIHGALKAASIAHGRADEAYNLADTADGKAEAAQDTADAALARTGGTMTGDIAMSGKKITGLGTPSADADAATKKYVDDAKKAAKDYADAQIAANDAMTFKGVLDDSHSLPTTANVGDTYKVGKEGTYGGIQAKVGDLIINNADKDSDAPTWVHISSGYEDDYLQKLGLSSDKETIYITDGVNTDYDSATSALKNKRLGSIKVIEDTATNIKVTTEGDSSIPNNITITVSMEWGSFAST